MPRWNDSEDLRCQCVSGTFCRRTANMNMYLWNNLKNIFRWVPSWRMLIISVHPMLLITLLSSITVFNDSIHMGSISPSRTIHFGPSCVMLACSLMIEEKRPRNSNKNLSINENSLKIDINVKRHAFICVVLDVGARVLAVEPHNIRS